MKSALHKVIIIIIIVIIVIIDIIIIIIIVIIIIIIVIIIIIIIVIIIIIIIIIIISKRITKQALELFRCHLVQICFKFVRGGVINIMTFSCGELREGCSRVSLLIAPQRSLLALDSWLLRAYKNDFQFKRG